MLDGAKRAFGKQRFNTRAQLDVKFIGEDAIDTGGPTRELMRIARKELPSLQIFAGEHAKILRLDYPGTSCFVFHYGYNNVCIVET